MASLLSLLCRSRSRWQCYTVLLLLTWTIKLKLATSVEDSTDASFNTTEDVSPEPKDRYRIKKFHYLHVLIPLGVAVFLLVYIGFLCRYYKNKLPFTDENITLSSDSSFNTEDHDFSRKRSRGSGMFPDSRKRSSTTQAISPSVTVVDNIQT